MIDFQNYLLNQGLSSKTVTAYLMDLKHFEHWFYYANGIKLSPSALTTIDIRDYRAQMAVVEKAAPATINRRLAAIRAYAKANGSPLEVKGVTEQQQAPHWLDRRQQASLLRELERNIGGAKTAKALQRSRLNYYAVVLLLNTGLRISELCNLQPGDVEISERKGSITVRAGKGEKNREIPLNKAARQALQHMTIPLKAKPRQLQRLLDSISKRIHIEISPHSLRHTFAKNLIDSQVSLDRVAALLGHESLDTTRLYTIPGEQDLIKAVGVLDD